MKTFFSRNNALSTLIISIGSLGFASNTYAAGYPVNVPEPSILALASLGLVGLAISRKRRK